MSSVNVMGSPPSLMVFKWWGDEKLGKAKWNKSDESGSRTRQDTHSWLRFQVLLLTLSTSTGCLNLLWGEEWHSTYLIVLIIIAAPSHDEVYWMQENIPCIDINFLLSSWRSPHSWALWLNTPGIEGFRGSESRFWKVTDTQAIQSGSLILINKVHPFSETWKPLRVLHIRPHQCQQMGVAQKMTSSSRKK